MTCIALGNMGGVAMVHVVLSHGVKDWLSTVTTMSCSSIQALVAGESQSSLKQLLPARRSPSLP